MKDGKEKPTLATLLKTGNVSFFGYRSKHNPLFVAEKKEGRIRFLNLKKNVPKNRTSYNAQYEHLGEVREEKSEVYFLDHEATKVLLVDFPASARYVCVRLVPRFEWVFALPGLLRRLLIGLVRIKGVYKMEDEKGVRSWLIIEHLLTETLHTRLSLSESIGIEKFLKHLKDNNVAYVILRFFEKLPKLYREGGDLDILVSDDDERFIKTFLATNSGSIGVDVWTVSRTTFNDVTYYPPVIAREIIDRAIDGPAGSRVPTPEHTFLALAYHALYHKGPFAGVPSNVPNVSINAEPENDYKGVLQKMAEAQGINVAITMEALDEYLYEKGWRPHLDTLAKIAPKNKWIWERFFSGADSQETGLGIFIVKKGVVKSGNLDAVYNTIEGYDGFKILKKKIFTEEEVQSVAKVLRGGVWEVEGAENPDDFLPSVAILVHDQKLGGVRGPRVASMDTKKRGIRNLKKVLRKQFDPKGKGSVIHATDNSRETWEYVGVCFPGEEEVIHTLVEEENKKLNSKLSHRIQNLFSRLPRLFVYHVVRQKKRTVESALRVIMRV